MTYGPAHADVPSIRFRMQRRGRWAAALTALLALAVTFVAAAGADAKVPKVFFGISGGGSVQQEDFQKMHDIKVRTFRPSISWSATEPQPGVFDWSRTDAQVAALAQNEISPVFSLYRSPEWATGVSNGAVPPLHGEALRAWKTFLEAVVKRYKAGGRYWRAHPEVPEEPAVIWQIWNEPNLPKYFATKGDPNRSVPHTARAYANLIKASDEAIHEADKNAKLILAGLSGAAKKKYLEPGKFMKDFLKVKKVTRHFDAAALHPYPSSIGDLRSRVSKFRKALNNGGAKKKEIWLTEIGWGSKDNGMVQNKGLAGQAKMLKKSFTQVLDKRRQWKIERLFWFDWRDPAPGSASGCSFCLSAGLLWYNGSPKPAYKTFKRFTKMQGKRERHHRHRRHHHGR
jgi:hypothetical protein